MRPEWFENGETVEKKKNNLLLLYGCDIISRQNHTLCNGVQVPFAGPHKG